MPAKWPPPIMHMNTEGLVMVEGRGTPFEASVTGGFNGTGWSCFFFMTSTMSCSSCSMFVNSALYIPKEVFEGSKGVLNQTNGGLPDPLFFLWPKNFSVSPELPSLNFACFLSKAVRVLLFAP